MGHHLITGHRVPEAIFPDKLIAIVVRHVVLDEKIE